MGNSAREFVFLLSRRWCMFPRLVSATVEARERAVDEGARAYKEAAVPTTSRVGSRASVTFGGRMTRAWCSRRNGTSQRPQWSPGPQAIGRALPRSACVCLHWRKSGAAQSRRRPRSRRRARTDTAPNHRGGRRVTLA